MSDPRNLSNWMRFLPDNWSTTKFTFPGTHNSHATDANYDDTNFPGVKDWTICQAMSIPEQLHCGVRFIDLRVGNDTSYRMRHGKAQLKNTLKDVLAWINDFLKQEKTETVLVSVKWDHDGVGEPHSMDGEIYHLWDGYGWYRKNDWPALGEVRGKAILLRRFWDQGVAKAPLNGVDLYPIYGQSWKGSPGAWSQNGDGKATDLKPSDVWDTVWKQINRASESNINDNWQHFTWLSHTGTIVGLSPATPWFYAQDLNSHLLEYLNDDGHHEDPANHRYGCIVTDFFHWAMGAEMVSRNWASQVHNPNTWHVMAKNDPFLTMDSPRGDKVQFSLTKRAVLKVSVNGQEIWRSGYDWSEESDNHMLAFEADGNLCLWRNDPHGPADKGGRSLHWNTETRKGWDTRLRFLAGPPYILVDFTISHGDVLWWPNK
ncbi:hypothetical protein A1O7_10032 [Cladophialophora yegresii CBS 114405]|uniref:Phosphatidylinositol-specific phospholipase C X domain-containing protein n=1 Tax=Cladophialophora yegresii CBS 114405 TaxID=1182544 RepID=W9VRA1_9EURO|nr:uncharacterized protein A1O7_10032 [Cladophialophora yegresii CBS 114405]EXJ54691.1 hypothetical protein A1O7_10032 [Cladophialophora yegresii CBS 114405]